MADAFFLSEKDRDLVQGLLDAAKSGRLAVTPRPNDQDLEDHQAPEVYIAKPPDEGIPALVEGTPDVPGSADCDIHKINFDGELEAVAEFTQTVYNLTTSIIASNYLTVQRTKYGSWIAGIATANQARWIKFSATEDFTAGEANVTIDSITYYDGTEPDTAPTSVENPGWAGLDNDIGLAFFNTDDGKYYIASMITVATDIMVGHRIDDSNNKKFETLWQQFHMRAAEATTSDWRTDHTGADCS